MTRDPLQGTMAGNYRLVARLGAGGMGEVYKGVHTTIGSKVAIKLLHAMAARDRAMQERFLLEAQAVNRIDHPGVVKVIDAGRTEGGRPFLVMELLDGQSLHELRKAGQLTIEEACRAMVAVLDALAAAHAAGVVHRDLKPANVLRTKDGRIVVLDFGVAKLMAGDAPVRLTMTGSAVGTPHYMAPEQIRGQEITPLVDVYAAGVVLFELLCNRRPFDNTDDESVMAGHLERRPPPPRALEPAIPTRVSDLILAALQKDPAKRPPSAAAMRDALRKAIGDTAPQRTRSVPPPPEESASLPTAAETPRARGTQQSRWRMLAVAGAAVFALLGLVLVIYAAKRSKAEHAAADLAHDDDPWHTPTPPPPVDALVVTCEQLVTIDPVGVPDANQAAVKAKFYQRCAEDQWDVSVIHCFVTVTTAFDLTHCITSLTEPQRLSLYGDLAGTPWSPIAGDEPIGPIPEAFVSITSVPSRAKLVVDGVELGETPWAGRLAVGVLIVDIAKPKYVTHTSTFEVKGEGSNVLRVKLKKIDPY